jgi:hypothetical protein
MSVGQVILIAYFIIGLVLALVWWNDEYKPEYEYEKDIDEVEEPMAVLLIVFLMFFWPVKLIKNWFESFVS